MVAKSEPHNLPSILEKFSLGALNLLTLPLSYLPQSWGLALGAASGWVIYWLWGKRREITISNLEMVKAAGALPADLDSTATAKAVFMNLGRSIWEAICCYHRGMAPILNRCHIESGQELIEAALAESKATGRGLLLLSGHIGSWETMCHYVAQTFNIYLSIVGRNTGNWAADSFMGKLRTSANTTYVSKQGAAKSLLGTLRAGGTLGLLLDQAVIGHPPSPTLPFLNLEASINVAPLKIARKVDAQMLLVLNHREGNKNYTNLYQITKPPASMPEEEAILKVASQFNELLGEYIRCYPDQWMWGHRRWK